MVTRLSTRTTRIIVTLICVASSSQGLTLILDFNDPGQANTSDIFGNQVSTFDIAAYGFLEADRATIYNSIFNEVVNDYLGIPPGASPIPIGMELDIDFEIGDFGPGPFGAPPVNGDTEYYYAQIGVGFAGPHIGFLGVAGGSTARTSGGASGINGRMLGSIFTDSINGLGGVGTQLTSGLLPQTTQAVAGTLSHEFGHAVSLSHIAITGATTPTGLNPLMGTGAIDLPNAARLIDREFAIQNADASFMPINQLIGAIGLRPAAMAVPEPSTALPMLLLCGLVALRRLRA